MWPDLRKAGFHAQLYIFIKITDSNCCFESGWSYTVNHNCVAIQSLSMDQMLNG